MKPVKDKPVGVKCPVCNWTGKVRFYDIGDGPEWCCPSCDNCFPSNPVVGDDGLTNAQRNMRRFADEAREHFGWPPAKVPGDPAQGGGAGGFPPGK